MTVKGLISDIKRWIGESASRTSDFFNSAGFQNFIRRCVAWIEHAVLCFANALGWLVDATIRFVRSDEFKNALRIFRKLVAQTCQLVWDAIKWIARWLYRIATSEFVKTGLADLSRLFNRYLPKPDQQVLAVAAVVFISIVLVLWVQKSDQPEPLPELVKTMPAPVKTPPIKTPPAKTSPPPVKTIPDSSRKIPEIVRIESGMPDFGNIPAGRERKAAFFGYFLPIVESQNRTIQKTRQKLDDWYQNRDDIGSRDANEISEIAARYRVIDFEIEKSESWQKLLKRVDVVPPSLALAQSANESAWGTSRFARQGFNFFGQWCFKKGCGLVPKKRDANKTHEVAAFDSPEESVEMYIRNLNSNSAYQPLRDIRAKLRDTHKAVTGYELAAGLNRYSERGTEYVSELREMIKFNQLARYDTF